MTDKEILEKAIQKAIDGGWDAYGWKHFTVTVGGVAWHDDEPYTPGTKANHDQVESLIFNHDFAKALWGEEWYRGITPDMPAPDHKQTWQHHLQQMVISEDPIKYLGNNL